MIHQQAHMQTGKHLYLSCGSQAAQYHCSRMTSLSLSATLLFAYKAPCFKQLSEKSSNFPYNRARLGQKPCNSMLLKYLYFEFRPLIK